LEAASGFEPLHKGFADLSLSHLGTPPLNWYKEKTEKIISRLLHNAYCLLITVLSGAGNGIRTRDPNLGKVVLYQLSYSRIWNIRDDRFVRLPLTSLDKL
jgi:hypothetical protein